MSQQVTKNTEQEMQNLGFDTTYNEPTLLWVGEDSNNNVLRRVQVDGSGFLEVTT